MSEASIEGWAKMVKDSYEYLDKFKIWIATNDVNKIIQAAVKAGLSDEKVVALINEQKEQL
jgi:uncharacterized protein YpmB